MRKNRVGALGAMMDEYERVADELLDVLSRVTEDRYTEVINPQAPEYTRSIQAIMHHVVRAAYGYANYIRKTWDIPVTSPETGPEALATVTASLREALSYTEETFAGRWETSDDDLDQTKMMSRWNVEYSIEQMMEHAIVHIMRHRRQIERVLKTSLS